MQDTVIRINNVTKEYRLGTIGGGTLKADLESYIARKRGRDDPNTKIGADIKHGRFSAIDGVSLEIHKGETIGIIGRNGAGKSTLLKMISRVTTPSEGEIYINGRIASMLEVGTGFHPELTGRENVYLNGAILGMKTAEIDRKFDEIVHFAEMEQFIDTPVKRYSSGMYVKLAFSVAAHLEAEIMIMDEVLAVGDAAFRKKSLEKMKRAASSEGKTVLCVSHNMDTIRELCSRCIVLDHGKVVFDGDTDKAIEIYSGVDGDMFKPYHNLRDARRPNSIIGENLHLTSFEFCKKDTAVYTNDEKMKIRLGFSANNSVDEVSVFAAIKNSDNQSVGTYEATPFCNAAAGKSYISEFEIDISALCDGTYSIVPDLVVCDGAATVFYDHVLEEIRFKVARNDRTNIEWRRSNYGSVRLTGICHISTDENQ
ncbi:MAG: ATP-binding cassette domain-containing protein [Clostridia bacterium]|nr:ATP-binding cassette domain-containing protein [Clostridia bacterium]